MPNIFYTWPSRLTQSMEQINSFGRLIAAEHNNLRVVLIGAQPSPITKWGCAW
jgi:hypothetical protein